MTTTTTNPDRDDACRACWCQCVAALAFLVVGWPLAALACVGFTLISRSRVSCIDLAADATGGEGR